MYQCVWIANRSANIIELRYGRSVSQIPKSELCADKEFENSRWITLGRQQSLQATACPISGDYTGVVPEEKLFCAKISSDCNNPDIMFYTVSLCQNRSHIFEQREYKCFGKWEEDGILYTYTQRRDMPGYQCFTGKLMAEGDEVYITEAGQNCVRGENPLETGMKITKQGTMFCLKIFHFNLKTLFTLIYTFFLYINCDDQLRVHDRSTIRPKSRCSNGPLARTDRQHRSIESWLCRPIRTAAPFRPANRVSLEPEIRIVWSLRSNHSHWTENRPTINCSCRPTLTADCRRTVCRPLSSATAHLCLLRWSKDVIKAKTFIRRKTLNKLFIREFPLEVRNLFFFFCIF